MIRFSLFRPIATALVFTSLALYAEAQTITRVTPEAASVGDTIILTGTNLQGTTSVRFFATVGGFVGVWNVDVAPTSVSPTRVTIVVPQMAAFAPPEAAPPGAPVGTVRATTLAGLTNTLPFFYLQATPNIDTAGSGSTQPGNIGKPVTSFTIAGGAPTSPNPNFVLTLENGVPNSAAILLVGLPGMTPYPIVSGGTFTLDPLAPIVILPSLPVNSNGDIQIAAGIPAGLAGLSIGIQWVVLAPGQFLSNGLHIDF